MAETETNASPVSTEPILAPPGTEAGTHPSAVYAEPPKYFTEALLDAERLLKYAAESGIAVDDATRDHVLQARIASETGWNEEAAANLITALTKLAVLVKPVTAESLLACCDDTVPTVRSYLRIAIVLAIFIVPFSIASFVASAISNAIRADIAIANDLAVKLRAQLGTPTTAAPASTPDSPAAAPPASASVFPPGLNSVDVIAELQQYASTIRAIDSRARQLNVLVFGIERDPFKQLRRDPAGLRKAFELPPGLANLAQAADDRTTSYQEVRYFAQNLLDDTSFFYGAITTCILPMLYALLGTCAYLLRSFEQQMNNRTFTRSAAHSARFLIAAIGGAVVGLFNNFTITQSASIPPLAIAFLVGYAVDVFFAFLEGLIQSFTRNSAASPAQSDAKPALGATARSSAA